MKRWLNLAKLPFRKAEVGLTPADVVHRENKWRLLHYRPRAQGLAFQTPLLLVPSLINRHYVLDLMPGKSFTEYLVGLGHDVFTIDWGTPGPEDRYLSFDELTDRYLGRAIRIAGEGAPGGKPHVLGYCLGGTLAAIHAGAHPDAMASLTALAAPVRFGEEGLLAAWTRTRSFDVKALVAGMGNVPWQLMQGAFHLLRPTLNLSKAVHLLDKAWDDTFLDGFLALETWGNDNVSFPGAAYETYIEELYRGDALARGSFALSGKRVRLGDVRMPVLAVTFQHDNIVPAASAAALLELVGSADKKQIHLPGGHVGAVVSRGAAKSLWPQLSQFWAERDGAVGERAPRPDASTVSSGEKSRRPPAAAKVQRRKRA